MMQEADPSFHIYFSNRIEILHQFLQKKIFSHSHPFAKRLIIVPNLAIKSWLMMEMAKNLGISTGLEFCLISEMLPRLFPQKSSEVPFQIPSRLELSLAIELEIRHITEEIQNLHGEEQECWKPLFQYLGISLESAKISRKSEKRLIRLADQLAHLFLQYGMYANKMILEWEGNLCNKHWQQQLWVRIFTLRLDWAIPQKLLSHLPPTSSFKNFLEVHFFATSHISQNEFEFLRLISRQFPVRGYLLSPCHMFWSDILSEKERISLLKNLKKKKISSSQEEALEGFLRENNPLLANFGRLGREMIDQIENAGISCDSLYVLPKSIEQDENYASLFHEECALEHHSTPLTLLQAVQSDMVLMRSIEEQKKISMQPEDCSIQVHVSSSTWREVENLYETLIELIHRHQNEDRPIYPKDILVMAPDMRKYAPFIKTVFGSEESFFDIQLMDLQASFQNPAIQVFLQILSLAQGRWETTFVMQLFEFPLFLKRHQLSFEDVSIIQKWVEEANVRWGFDPAHRKELLQRDQCLDEIVENPLNGTWEGCFSRLLMGMAMTGGEDDSTVEKLPKIPLDGIEISKGELIGKWIFLLRSLREDLKKLSEGRQESWDSWGKYLVFLAEKYVVNGKESEEESPLIQRLELFRQNGEKFKDELFSYATIHYHLKAIFNECRVIHNESHIEAVRFCSMLPMRAIPARILVLIGMEEGAFPAANKDMSLNMMKGYPSGNYYPTQTDYDRFLFLETLLSARDYLIFSYQGISDSDHKEQLPSLVISELLAYLDEGYEIEGKKISESCVYRHPFASFDQKYFSQDKKFPCRSLYRLRAAEAFYSSNKSRSHQFFSTFSIKSDIKTAPQEQMVLLRQLEGFARNPLKTYFNQSLGVFLKEEKEKHLDEKFVLTNLDMHHLKRKSLYQPPHLALSAADKRGDLPCGIFKTVAISRVQEESAVLKNCLSHLDVSPEEVFEIECAEHCEKPTLLSSQSWLLPPLRLDCENGTCIKIIGKLSEVTQKGLLAYAENSHKDVLKVWPQYLVFNALTKTYHLPIENNLLLIKSKSKKEPFFQDPFPLLKNYINYYLRSQNTPSPLIPEWTFQLINSSPDEFDEHVSRQLNNSFSHFYNHYVKWIARGVDIPSSCDWLHEWKDIAESIFGEMCRSWFPPKRPKRSEETADESF